MPEAPRPFAEKRAHDSHAERARAIVDSLRATEPGSAEVFDAFWELDALPVDDVRAALAGWVGPLPELDALDDAVRRVHGLPPRPLRLRALSSATDADVLDLGPVAEAQLRIAGTTWDGADLSPEERLDGELEGSFAGSLELRVLADADAPGDVPLFDVVLLGEGAGVVFPSGGTKMVALIAYGRVETKDARVRVAIEAALAEPEIGAMAERAPASGVKAVPHEEPEAPAPVATIEELPPVTTLEEPPPVTTIEEPAPAATVTKAKAKKSAAKKIVAKKGAPKKTAAKKAGAKKTPAKKGSAKKTAAKKGSAKKTAAKKGPAKKATAAGKVAAKKAGAKKKTAAKKKR